MQKTKHIKVVKSSIPYGSCEKKWKKQQRAFGGMIHRHATRHIYAMMERISPQPHMFSYNILIRFYFKTFLWDPKTRKHICEFQWGQDDGGSSFLPLDLLHNKCPFSFSNGGEGGRLGGWRVPNIKMVMLCPRLMLRWKNLGTLS
jgi:hypothetical protein